jgi:hypothetical protein
VDEGGTIEGAEGHLWMDLYDLRARIPSPSVGRELAVHFQDFLPEGVGVLGDPLSEDTSGARKRLLVSPCFEDLPRWREDDREASWSHEEPGLKVGLTRVLQRTSNRDVHGYDCRVAESLYGLTEPFE